MSKQKITIQQKTINRFAKRTGRSKASAKAYLNKVVKGEKSIPSLLSKSDKKEIVNRIEEKQPEQPKRDFDFDFDDFDDIDNPLYGDDVDGREIVTVEADFGYYGGQRKMSLSLSKSEMKELTSAKSLDEAVSIFASSKDGSFMSSPDITDIKSIKKGR